jgi:hypothetical protein
MSLKINLLCLYKIWIAVVGGEGDTYSNQTKQKTAPVHTMEQWLAKLNQWAAKVRNDSGLVAYGIKLDPGG